MALTRANVEALMIKRVGKLLTLVSLDGTTVNGSNTDLNDPIGWAIRRLSLVTDDPATVDNDDVARVGVDSYNQFLDLVEYRALENILGNWDLADVVDGPHAEKLGDLLKTVQARLLRKQSQLLAEYGIGLSTITVGVIGLGFQQENSTTSDE